MRFAARELSVASRDLPEAAIFLTPHTPDEIIQTPTGFVVRILFRHQLTAFANRSVVYQTLNQEEHARRTIE
jgi:hypothetical protein